MKFGIVVFPGSNCDHDVYHVVRHVLGQPATFLWHKDRDLQGSEVVVLPGGFSYGDYLRSGAIARFSPVMEEVVAFAKRGGVVLGICNGFQIAAEAGLLPGALLKNASRKFVCKPVQLTVEGKSRFTRTLTAGERLTVPVAHGQGSYFLEPEGLKRLEGEGQVAFRYVDNPNGSVNDIAGVVNAQGNVLGMMPHPERASEALLGSIDGRRIFESVLGG